MKQSSCKIIGLTGGIATGKSTVTSFLVDEGFRVIDADKIAREVVEIGTPAYKDIVESFGLEVLTEEFVIDRKKLGSIIFNDESLRKKLNIIVHPRVFESIKKLIKYYCEREKVVFLDVPLLIEEMESFTKYGVKIDEIWLVYVDEGEQLERLMKRDELTFEEAKVRMESQMPMEVKKKYATRLINNNQGLDELKNQIQDILYTFK